MRLQPRAIFADGAQDMRPHDAKAAPTVELSYIAPPLLAPSDNIVLINQHVAMIESRWHRACYVQIVR